MHHDIAETIFFRSLYTPAPPSEDDLRVISRYIASSTPWRSLVHDVMRSWAYGNPYAEIQLQISCVPGTQDHLVVCVDENPVIDLGECLLGISDTNLQDGWDAVSMQASCETAIGKIDEALRGLIRTAQAAEDWTGDKAMVFRAFANTIFEADAMDSVSNFMNGMIEKSLSRP